jgi:YbgC/YbaW family acyl-CoA thioester hydrolase
MPSTTSLNPTEFRFQHRLTVRPAEVDGVHVVFHGHYLNYFDTAVMDFWRALGLPYRAVLAQWQGELLVRKATLDYLAPARDADRLAIGIRVLAVGRSSLTLQGAIWRERQLLASVERVSVWVDSVSLQPQALPPALRQLLLAQTAGQTLNRLVLGSWALCGMAAQTLRRAVFVQEQGVPEHEEWDAADAQSLHAVLYNSLEQAIATGRLLPSEAGVGRIGRMAVHAELRGQGHGAQLLDALIEAARARGDQWLELHAQLTAVCFYRRRGFAEIGEPYLEVGIAHQTMRLQLDPAGAPFKAG